MKKIKYLFLLLPLLIYSCEKMPRAYFSATPGDPDVGQEVWFTNESDNSSRFEWDFGDGYISDEVNPVHVFTASGPYTVTLKAYGDRGSPDVASLTLNVMIPTLLEIEVLEYYQEYPVKDASVILYPSLDDWDNETNMVNEGITDEYGKVVFSDLDNIPYYADVWEATHDNYALRDEDVGFIRTPQIMPHMINRFIAYVDYVDHGKGDIRRGKSVVIRKIERKSDEKYQPEPYTDKGDWESLMAKVAGK